MKTKFLAVVILTFGKNTKDTKIFIAFENNSKNVPLTSALLDRISSFQNNLQIYYSPSNPMFWDLNVDRMIPHPERKSNRQKVFFTLICFMALNKDF
jgi:hypothetical protein